MTDDSRKAKRRSIRLKGFDYSRDGYYFLTMCSHRGESIFGHIYDNGMEFSELGEIAQSYWERLPERYPAAESTAFVVMPNHVHGIVHVGAIHELPLQELSLEGCNRRKMLIPRIVGWFKMNTAKRINQLRNTAVLSGSATTGNTSYEIGNL